ncbi:UDP-N-acetylmuramoyl-tripeptide--D-alanyl-D-alanine ligase [Clostridium acetobutylicum]|uniref:UDP-N-acetylmuramoyl-tripeptide--D-alanyl-D- alanine ligase n=1 Tax=Clostridium TaxID=1485 RepID=UPI000200A670|nr:MULTISPECIES: UDP-N-acetylmuramoyl-tripeptide--D-alanyl-D-alanine ligase [Clostridium]ADZ21179.1 UDP-N-acetylmuramyl pentapeptide synthase [Clostridium acetobutylicum EA 2018]MBC2394540.1 UDP-N-acetylmuramoyl-tripeptide--D-alanyl-D-alanine ligase [Clostridium acetobutylicum]MBC2583502.1 UDP-N-acetylmuramoyl-tripeptide--D-alanyl-D-alanine ligase [Clostridium acetobutylicum]NOV88788.1 UDP-N-acetylmuramoyl-tripeptide--D-alanyl-D-alanine ligase [Clostridium acetobutylicum]NOW12871.1 UDP-N-acety
MENLTFNEIAKAVNGKVILRGSKDVFNDVSIDTRKLSKGAIFIAINGENFNGNKFIHNAVQKGAALCIVDEIHFEKDSFKEDISILLVEDTKKALLDLAEFYRSTLNIKVVAITGSTGKTSTKDITASVLRSKFRVFKTSGNFNNEIGLPLMIFKLDKSYEVAVLEMGMNHFNEIHNMAKAARPDIALITNIGISHIENLKSRENILKAKLEITDFFTKDNLLIVNGDNDLLKKHEFKSINVLKTSLNKEGNLNAENLCLHEGNSEFEVQGEKLVLNMPGKHNIENAMLSIAAALKLGLTFEEIRKGLKDLELTAMRLDIVNGENIVIVDDSYNASPDSMIAAIDVTKNLKGNRRIAVLGTMRELGEKSYESHKEVGAYAKENNIDELLVVGEFSKAYLDGYKDKENFSEFETNEELLKFVKTDIRKGDIFLIKASRLMKFENIVTKLKELDKEI